jgi:hypothetical protein
MNRTAAYLISILAILGVAYVAFLGGVEIREWHKESACISQGGVPLWQSSSATDSRPDGMLPFHCDFG